MTPLLPVKKTFGRIIFMLTVPSDMSCHGMRINALRMSLIILPLHIHQILLALRQQKKVNFSITLLMSVSRRQNKPHEPHLLSYYSIMLEIMETKQEGNN